MAMMVAMIQDLYAVMMKSSASVAESQECPKRRKAVASLPRNRHAGAQDVVLRINMDRFPGSSSTQSQ